MCCLLPSALLRHHDTACHSVRAAVVQNLRRDFMTGILSEEELGGKHLYVHELRRGCACSAPTRLRFHCQPPI